MIMQISQTLQQVSISSSSDYFSYSKYFFFPNLATSFSIQILTDYLSHSLFSLNIIFQRIFLLRKIE
jgi:hypothetical protein